ncbi:hypothetical protein [Streptomyces smyrnaeus]|uniref:hypothetical protein n=1 Tax=Streptomyces smyrnaeus TaxID=1387713 RepID=UPI00340D3D97
MSDNHTSLSPETLQLVNDHLVGPGSLNILENSQPDHPLHGLTRAILTTATDVEESRADFLAYTRLETPSTRSALLAESAGEHTRARKDLIQMLAAYRHALLTPDA